MDAHVYNPVDPPYNADPTGSAGCSAAFQQVIVDACAGSKLIFIPKGDYKLDAPLVVQRVKDLQILGAGAGRTRLVWAGDAGVDAFTFRGCQTCEVGHMELYGSTARPPRSLLRSTSMLNYTYVPFGHHFHDLFIGGGSHQSGLANMGQYGIAVERESDAPDYNNSEHQFHRIGITDLSGAGVYINQGQAKTILMDGLNIGTVPIGVQCLNGAFNWNHGNINAWTGFPGEETSGVCFAVGAPNDWINIHALQSESTGRLLTVNSGVAGGSSWAINISGCRYATNQLHPDGRFIIYPFRGPLNIWGNLFGHGGVLATPGRIYLSSSGGYICANIFGNSAHWVDSRNQSLVEAPIPFTGIREYGNTYLDYAGPPNNTGRLTRSHSGRMTVTASAGTLRKTFEVPRHHANSYTILPVVIGRSGASAQSLQISGVAQDVAGFTLSLSGALSGSDTLTVAWKLEEA